MTRNKFDIKLVKEYLIAHPKASNKDLYQYCSATTQSQKSNVRRKKLLLAKKKVGTDPPGDPNKKKLTESYIEQKILDALEDDPKNTTLIGKAVDFYVRIKGGKAEELKDEIDMEVLKQLGLDISNSD